MKETGQIKPEDKENFMNQESQTPHKRRVRYKGKYPKKFEEKYKELQPEKYKGTIEHVISKGNTPAGMHISIMVKEIIDFLEIRPGQVGFDATLGYGGHTKAMLECLKGQGHMYATDVDPEESAKTRKRLAEQGFGEDILTIKPRISAPLMRSRKKSGALILSWRILGYLPCRSTIQREVFLLKWTDLWI